MDPRFLKAQWVWCGGEPAPVNAVANFRSEFHLGKSPAEAILLISADSRFVVYLNGTRIGYGPPRNFPEHYQYDKFAVGPLLIRGVNVLAVTVVHWGEGTFQSLPSRAGLIAEILDENGKSLSATGGNWKGRIDPSYRRDAPRIACQLGFEEQEEGGSEDWLVAGYEDACWNRVGVIGGADAAPWGALTRSTIPALTNEVWNSVSVRDGGLWRQPSLVLGLRTNDNLTPGNRMVNSDHVEGFFAARLKAGKKGLCVIRRCAMYGGPMRVYMDGKELALAQDQFDLRAEVLLERGEHLFVVEWTGITHDKDTAFAFSGMENLELQSFRQSPGARWIFCADLAKASSIRMASNGKELFLAEPNWVAVAAENAPEFDTYMSVSSSSQQERGTEELLKLPARFEPLADPQAVHRAVVDFARHGLGFLELDLDAVEGAVVEMLGCEGASNGRIQLTEFMSNTARYTCREGRQRFSSIVPRGLRFLILQIRPGARPLALHGARLRVATYPWKPKGFFRCSDPRLNQIYEMCCHTLRMSSTDVFVDATYEQALWVGDMASMTLPVHFYVQGDPRLPARSLRMVGQSLERFPLAQSQVPSSWTDRPIPNWSFFWVLGVKDYFLFTGDKALVRSLFPALLKQADFVIASLNSEGLFEMHGEVWHFLDWNGLEADHQATQPKVFAHENLLALASLQATLFLARALRRESVARKLEQVAKALRKAVCRHFQDSVSGAFREHRAGGKTVDGVTASTQICALLAGLSPGPFSQAALNTIAPPPQWVPTGTPWMWSLGALMALRAGHAETVISGIRNHWGRMLDHGSTTAWEMFEGCHRPGLPTRSWCHGWSAGPAWLLPAYILGARPASPGWKQVLIEPVPGDLQWAEGNIPTPIGNIRVAWEKAGAGLELNVKLPLGCRRAYESKRTL